MRFNILGFDQVKACANNLTIEELMILRHMHDFASSGKMETIIHEGEMYYWIKYDKFINDLPILNMKKTRLMEIFNNNLCVKPLDWEDRFNNMSESSKKRAKSFKFVGVLKSFTKKDKTGTYSYFTFTEKFYDMIPDITNDDLDMKKAPTLPQVEASEELENISSDSTNKNSNNSIPQNKKTNNKKEFKPNYSLNPKIHKNLSTNFLNYGNDEDLERMLLENQKSKFNEK